MVSHVARLAAWLAASPAFVQVMAPPKTEPSASPTFAQIGLFIYPGSVDGMRGRINLKQTAAQSGAQQAGQANLQAVDQFK